MSARDANMISKWKRNAPQMLPNDVLDSHGRPQGTNMDQSIDLGPSLAPNWRPKMKENRVIYSKKPYLIAHSIFYDFRCRKWTPWTFEIIDYTWEGYRILKK